MKLVIKVRTLLLIHEYSVFAPVLGEEDPFSRTERVKGMQYTLASRCDYRITTRMQIWPPQVRHSLSAGIASMPLRNSCTIYQDKSGYHVIVFIPGVNKGAHNKRF